MKLNRDECNVKWVAHRGFSARETENTCAAFVAAGKEKGFFAIESDVHVTKDGAYLMHHDSDTYRMCGEHHIIEQTEASVLRALGQIDLHTGKVNEALRLPELSDYFEICRAYEKWAVLELKESMQACHVAGIADAAKQCDMLEKTIFITFYPENLLALRKLLPQQPAQFLTQKTPHANVLAFLRENRFDLDIRGDKLTAAAARRLRAQGCAINCWTVNDPDLAKRLCAKGADYLTSNELHG